MKISKNSNILLRYLLRYRFQLLIIIISLFYLVPFFQKGFPIGQDNTAQLVRTAERIKAMSDGQLPVRWAADLNYGYGHPGFVFFYSLPGYLGALLYFLGIGLESSYKILMILVFILSPVSFYYWIKQIFNEKIAFVVSLVYGLAPYSLLDTFVRIHLGESLALLFIPLTLFFIEKNFKKVSTKNILLGGFTYCLLIHSHSILSLIFSFIFSGYIVVKTWRNRKLFVASFLLLAIGLLLSSYFIIPALLEGKYINSALFLRDWYKSNFLNIGNLIYSPWGFGSNTNAQGGLSAQIGPIHVFIVACCTFLFFKKNIDRKLIIFWISIFFIGLFMSISASEFIWNRVHLLQQFQFPWRFTSVTFFSASVLSGYLFHYSKNRYFLWVILLGILVFAVPLAKIWKIENQKNDKYYFTYPGTAAYHNEATTIWVEGDAYAYPVNKIEIISGYGQITENSRKSNVHEFNLDAKGPVRILDNTVYFPGWRVIVDGKKVPIEFQDINYRGLITFNVSNGTHKVRVIFTESPVRLLSDLITIMGIGIFVVSWIFRKKLDVFLQKI